MEITKYFGMLMEGERELADAFLLVADRHQRDAEVHDTCKELAQWSNAHRERLKPFIDKYGEDSSKKEQVNQVRSALFHGTRVGGMGLLADLQDLALLTNTVIMQWTTVLQAARGMHDKQLETVADESCKDGDRQLAWIRTHIKSTAPQALLVPVEPDDKIAASMPKRPNATNIQDIMWAPIAAAVLMAIVGIIGVLTGRPLLFPSLGPTAYLQAENPANPASRFYNTVVGHMAGLISGFFAVALFNAWNSPTIFKEHVLSPDRAAASALALGLTLLFALLLKASHPPAGATTLLVSLGGFRILEDAIMVVIGVLIVAVAGELARRMRLGQVTMRPERSRDRVPAPKAQS